MSGYTTGTWGPYLINGNATAYWTLSWGARPDHFMWITAEPMYPHNSVQVIPGDNWMDENGGIHHNYAVKNLTGNAGAYRVVALWAWP